MSRQVTVGLQYAAIALVVLIGGVALAPCFSGRHTNGTPPADPSAADREPLATWSRLEGDVGFLLLASGEGGETAAFDRRVLDQMLSIDGSMSYWRLYVTNFSAEEPFVLDLGAGTLSVETDGQRVGNVDLLSLASQLEDRDRLILNGLGAGFGRFELPPLASRGFLLGLPTDLTPGDASPALRTENGEVVLRPLRLPRGEVEDYLERPEQDLYLENPVEMTAEAVDPEGEE